MGVSRRGGANTTFLQVRAFGEGSSRNGYLARKHKTKPEDVPEKFLITKEDKAGNPVYYEVFNQLEGYLIDMELDMDNKYGEQLTLKFFDDEDNSRYNIDIFADSYFGRSFFQKMHNIDITKKLTLQPYSFQDSNNSSRYVTGITFRQDGEKLEDCYTREEPNGRPALIEKKKGSKTVYDNTDMMNFYYEEFDRCKRNIKQIVSEITVEKGDDYEEDDVVDTPAENGTENGTDNGVEKGAEAKVPF